MTAKGTLTECIEDMEIHVEDTEETLVFFKDILYTALISDEIYIIDRSHKNIKINNALFKRHFRIKN